MSMDNQSQPGCEPEGKAPVSPPLGLFPACAIALALWCGAAAKVGLLGLGIAPFFLAVAVYAARGQISFAGALIPLAGVSVFVAAQDWKAAVFSALTAAAGLVLGVGIAQQWTYGRIAVAATAAVFAVHALFLASIWDDIEESANRYQAIVDAQLGQAEAEPAEDAEPGSSENPVAPPSAASRELLEMYRWLIPEWRNILLGSTFATILVGVFLALSGTSWWLRRHGGLAGPRGTFLTMRPPDWLVWVVILTAACWFGDRQWPNTILRPLSWNVGLGLTAVYWLNGIGILLYGMRVLQAAPFLIGLVVAGMVCFGMQPVALIGLFDTWFECRGRLDALAAARKERHDLEGPGA